MTVAKHYINLKIILRVGEGTSGADVLPPDARITRDYHTPERHGAGGRTTAFCLLQREKMPNLFGFVNNST